MLVGIMSFWVMMMFTQRISKQTASMVATAIDRAKQMAPNDMNKLRNIIMPHVYPEVVCHHCRSFINVNSEILGNITTCPECNNAFTANLPTLDI